MPAEEIGRRGPAPGLPGGHLLPVVDRQLLPARPQDHRRCIDPARDDPAPAATVLDFWERAAAGLPGRRHPPGLGHGHGHALRRGRSSTPCSPASTPVDDDDTGPRSSASTPRWSNYLFLLYFDTRAGYGDTGPYRARTTGRSLLVRDFYRLGQSDFPWSSVAKDVPYHHLTAALVLDGVDCTITDFGTSNHTPEDYLDHLVGFGLYTTDGRPTGRARARSPPRRARRRSWPRSATAQSASTTGTSRRWTATRRSAAGAYVYFSFLRPFAEMAGVADELDWTVPRDLPARCTSSCRRWRARTPASPRTRPYYELYPEVAP